MRLIVNPAGEDRGYDAASYMIVRDGYIPSESKWEAQFVDTLCYCDEMGCDHVVAHDCAYYNQAPSLDDARKLVEAFNDSR
jgi:hypothetical protein